MKMKEKKKKRSADNKVFSAVCLLTYEQRGIQSGIVDVPKTVSHKSIHRIPINIYPAVDPFLRRTSIKITQKLQDVHLSLGVAPWPRGRERQPKKKKKKKRKTKTQSSSNRLPTKRRHRRKSINLVLSVGPRTDRSYAPRMIS